MKKVTKLVTLVTTGLCALALVPAYLATAEAVQAANDTHAIEFVADNGVTVNVPVVARAGKVVNFSVNYDAETYEVYGCLANYELCAQTTLNDFYFVMPDEDVELNIVGAGITNEEEGLYAVNNVKKDQGVVLNYADPTAYAGQYVYFSVGFVAGSAYTWTGDAEVYYTDFFGAKQEVATYELGQGIYYFEMPEAEVFVDVGLETKGFLATFDETANVDKVEVSSDEGKHWSTVTGNPYFIKAFDQVRVTLKDTLKKTCSGIKIGEESYLLEEGAKTVTFNMPGADCDVKVVTEEILYEITTADDELTNHYEYEFYRCDTSSGEYVKTTKGACYNQYVRVYAKNKEGVTGRKIGTLRYSYDTSLSYSWTDAQKGEDADGNTYYQFYLSYGKPYQIKVTVENEAKPVAVKNTEHVKAKYVTKENGKWVEKKDGFYAGDNIYAQFTCDEGYKAGDPKVSYKYSATSTYTGSTAMSVFDAKNNVYRTNATITSTAYVDYAIEWTELSQRTVSFAEDELATFKFVKQDEKHDWVENTNPAYFKGDYCYVQVNFTGSAEDYVFNGIKALNGTSTLSITTQSAEDKVYSFVMPDADVSVSALYKSLAAYKGYGFCGTFYGNNLYNNQYGSFSSKKTGNNAYTVKIDGSGAGTWGTSYVFDVVDLAEGSTKDSGFITDITWKMSTSSSAPTARSTNWMAYGKDFVASYYSITGTYDAKLAVDLNIAVKAQEDSDTYSDYSFCGTTNFTSNSTAATNTGWSAFEAYRKGTLYKCGFIDKTTGYSTYYLSDVSFVFSEGSTVSDKANAVYDVYAGETKIGTVNKGTFTKA